MRVTKKKLLSKVKSTLPFMEYEQEDTWHEIEVDGEFFDVNLYNREVFDLAYTARCTNDLRAVVYKTEQDKNNPGFRTTSLHLPEVLVFNTSIKKLKKGYTDALTKT